MSGEAMVMVVRLRIGRGVAVRGRGDSELGLARGLWGRPCWRWGMADACASVVRENTGATRRREEDDQRKLSWGSPVHYRPSGTVDSSLFLFCFLF